MSLACSNTEIVCALGSADRLVGVDSHSDHPVDVVSSLPRLGPDLEIDIAAVAALEPDLVLASLTVPGHETVIEGLEAAGLPFLAPQPESLQDVYSDIRSIAHALGVPERGDELVSRMTSRITPQAPAGGDRSEPTGHGGAEGPRVLVQWWPKPTIAPGRRSWTHDVILSAGARNALGDQDVQSRPLTDDEVVALDPDAIVISWCGVDPSNYRPEVVLNKPDFAPMTAIRHGRVYCVPEAFLGRPGPRLVNGVQALRDIVSGLISTESARRPRPSFGAESPGREGARGDASG